MSLLSENTAPMSANPLFVSAAPSTHYPLPAFPPFPILPKNTHQNKKLETQMQELVQLSNRPAPSHTISPAFVRQPSAPSSASSTSASTGFTPAGHARSRPQATWSHTSAPTSAPTSTPPHHITSAHTRVASSSPITPYVPGLAAGPMRREEM